MIPSELPIKVSPKEAEVLVYMAANRGQPYEEWPEELRDKRAVHALSEKKIVVKKYMPVQYFLTRLGSDLAHYLQSVLSWDGKSCAA